MPALSTDRIWTTRPGVSPTVPGQPADYLTIADIATGFAAGAIATTAIAGLAAFVTAQVAADETDFAATSNGSITITAGGTNGHAPNLVVNWAGATAGSIPVSALNGLAAAITAGETAFAATSTNSSVTITAGGTNGHAPNLAVNWAGAPAASIPSTAISGTVAPAVHTHVAADVTDFTAAVSAAETVTSLAYNGGTTTLTYTDENGSTTVVNLSALATDFTVTGATFAGTVLTLQDNNGAAADVTVDLAAFASTYTNVGNGTYTLVSGTGASTTVDVRSTAIPITDAGNHYTGTTVEAALQEAGAALAAKIIVSANASNAITAGTDGGAFLNIANAETTTSLAQAAATGVITYTNEDAVAQTANIRAGEATNLLSIGANGGVLLLAPTTHLT